MNGAMQGASAKIFQFPVGGRGAAAANRPENRFAREVEALKNARLVIGDSWYHDEAVAEASPSRKS